MAGTPFVLTDNILTNKRVKEMNKTIYQAPQIEVIEVAIEQGIATTGNNNGYNNNPWN